MATDTPRLWLKNSHHNAAKAHYLYIHGGLKRLQFKNQASRRQSAARRKPGTALPHPPPSPSCTNIYSLLACSLTSESQQTPRFPLLPSARTPSQRRLLLLLGADASCRLAPGQKQMDSLVHNIIKQSRAALRLAARCRSRH